VTVAVMALIAIGAMLKRNAPFSDSQPAAAVQVK
jgi:hypothetical protein